VDLATGGGSVVAGLASTEDGGYRHRQSNTHSQWVVPSLPGYAASQPAMGAIASTWLHGQPAADGAAWAWM